MLENATDYMINGYLKMLAVIIQQVDQENAEQISMFKRIVAGTKSEASAQLYLGMALHMSIDEYGEFANTIKMLPLKYRFILDALILCVLQKREKVQLSMVSDFAGFMEVDRNEVKYLAMIAKAVVCMDTAVYVNAGEIKPETISEDIFSEYRDIFIKKSVIITRETMVFQTSGKQIVTLEDLKKIEKTRKETVKLINVNVDLSNFELSFINRKQIIFDNCRISGGNNSIQFKSCESVEIRNCSFINFRNSVFNVENIENLSIQNTMFFNCFWKWGIRMEERESLGEIIYSKNPESVKNCIIDECVFDACGGEYNHEHQTVKKKEIISNCIAVVRYSFFYACRNYCHEANGYLWKPGKTTSMFPRGTVNEDCTFNNSANFTK